MKFPHNTDSFANYLAGIAQIDDNRDYRAMLARERVGMKPASIAAHEIACGETYRELVESMLGEGLLS